MARYSQPKIQWIMIPFFYILFLPGVALAYNLPVPFTSQAPEGNWNQPWFDACEETAIAMVDAYYRGSFIKESHPRSILEIFNIKHAGFGASLDENAKTVAALINNWLPWEAEAKENPRLEEIQAELEAGRPVIIPAYGKALGNPHFRGGGPSYHMFVISGYDHDRRQFLVQEPGTRFGHDYRYSYTTVFQAMHDYLPNGETKNGRPVAIFTRGQRTFSQNLDADQDGLTKDQEIALGTSLWHRDSDRDGYDDGAEISQGYLPLVNENVFLSWSLLKTTTSPKVYLIQNGQKQHIANEAVFLRHGWQWRQIVTVSQKFLEALPTEETLH